MDYLKLLCEDSSLAANFDALFDFFLLDEPTKRDEVEGRCTFSVDGVAFARDGAGGEYHQLEDGSIGYMSSEGECGRIAESVDDGNEKDRDVTIKYFNDFVKPDYEVRWFVESLGNDTLGFTVLSGAEWSKLDDEFGADTVRYYFEPIDLESNMFNLDMDEVSALLELRENNR